MLNCVFLSKKKMAVLLEYIEDKKIIDHSSLCTPIIITFAKAILLPPCLSYSRGRIPSNSLFASLTRGDASPATVSLPLLLLGTHTQQLPLCLSYSWGRIPSNCLPASLTAGDAYPATPSLSFLLLGTQLFY